MKKSYVIGGFMTRGIINTNTGEFQEIEDSKIITVWEKIDVVKKKLENSYFVKFYGTSLDMLTKIDFSKAEYKLILSLLRLINFESNIIAINGIPANKKTLAGHLKINIDYLGRQLKKLEDKDIIKREKDGRNNYYYFNPFVASYGRKISNNVLKFFGKSIWNCTNIKN
jgi:DNA-binding MarR family transcriptional regulator